MDKLNEIISSFKLSFEELKEQYKDQFEETFNKQKDWICNVEDKTSLVRDVTKKQSVEKVISKLKDIDYKFDDSDIKFLGDFTSSVDNMVKIDNWINGFSNEKVNLSDLFNKIKLSHSFSELDFIINDSDLRGHLLNLFSVVKHCQDPTNYPIYYKFPKNLSYKIFSVAKGNYDVFCNFYRSEFPQENRHLNFSVFWEVIGDEIIKKINEDRSILSDKNKIFLRKDFFRKDQSQRIGLSGDTQNTYTTPEAEESNEPLNQILYGPPGTGKTYNTINKALEIVDKAFSDSIDGTTEDGRKKLVEKFNEYRKSGRIEFITFHQNYSYEDFIQGIKPNINANKDSNLSFVLKDGIFFRTSVNSLFESYIESKKLNTNLSTEIDINYIYLEFLENLKQKQDQVFNTSNNSIIKISSFTRNENVKFKHEDSLLEYTVSKDRLLKLFEKYPDISKIIRINQDIVDVIGGCNATIYWVALKEFITFFNMFKNNNISISDVNSQAFNEDIDFEIKKKLISNSEITITSNKNYVIIIDEINRANISRVFGELITLIEEDKRWGNVNQMEVTLPSGEDFTVPKNLYIIGTMNMADKSIALLDIALRRRFKFIPMYPNYTCVKDNKLKVILESLNKKIKEKKGIDFMIGHSFFMNKEYKHLEDIVNNDLLPLIIEYFNNKEDKVIDIFKAANIKVDSDAKTSQLKFIRHTPSQETQVTTNEQD